MDSKETFRRIKFFRLQRNLSARELSLRIDKNENYINRLECLGSNIPINVLYEIIDVLGTTPEEFFASNYQTYKSDNELYNLIKTMPQDKKNSLIDFIKHF